MSPIKLIKKTGTIIISQHLNDSLSLAIRSSFDSIPSQRISRPWQHWGNHFGRDKGKWTLGYIAADVNLPRVLISLNEGRVKEIEFSTKRQGELLESINQILWDLKKTSIGNDVSQL